MESSGGQRLQERQRETQHPDQKPPTQTHQRSAGCCRKTPGIKYTKRRRGDLRMADLESHAGLHLLPSDGEFRLLQNKP